MNCNEATQLLVSIRTKIPLQKLINYLIQKGYLNSLVSYINLEASTIFTTKRETKVRKMTISKVLIAILVVSAVAMTLLENVEGGREMAPKKPTAKTYPQELDDNYEGYKPKEDYEGYKPKEDYECDGYKYKDKDCYEYGNCDKSPYNEDVDHQYNWGPYKKPITKPKEMGEKYGVHQSYP